MVFIDLPIFSRCASTLFSDEDLTEMQNTLLENPAAGDLIPGGKGAYANCVFRCLGAANEAVLG
ncbi:MAG: hypothetical protein WC091_16370 [Sulfuricellaceae bacterium]